MADNETRVNFHLKSELDGLMRLSMTQKITQARGHTKSTQNSINIRFKNKDLFIFTLSCVFHYVTKLQTSSLHHFRVVLVVWKEIQNTPKIPPDIGLTIRVDRSMNGD